MEKIKTRRVIRAVEAFGAEVRRARETQGLSRTDVAALAGLTHITIRNTERGRCEPSLSTALKLSAALRIRLDDFRIQAS